MGRFITIVGLMPDIIVSGGSAHSEIHSCLVGPVLDEDDFMGASCLPSIARLESATSDLAQCAIESGEARWAEDAKRVELRVQVSSAGAAASLQILFSVTILASAGS
jgi:hypothetical protein